MTFSIGKKTDPEPPGGRSGAWPRPRYAWAVVALLMIIYTVAFIDRQILALLVDPVKRDLGVTDLQFGLLTGLSFGLFYTVFGIPFARLADNRSRRGLIAIGIALWSLATAACGLVRTFPMLFLARMGVGVGEATLTPAANSMICDLFPPSRRGRAISLYTLGIPFGSALAFLFGGAVISYVDRVDAYHLPLLGALQGWQMTFLIVGLPGVLLSLAMMVLVREPHRHGRVQTDKAMSVADAARYFLIRWRFYVVGFVGIAFLSALGYGSVYFIAAFYGRIHGFSPGETGLAYGLVQLSAGIGGILFAGWLADKWVVAGHQDAHFRILILALILGAPFALAYPLVGSPVLAIALMAGSIFFTNWIWGTAYAAVASATPNDLRGQATAIYLFAINLIGMGLGPTLVGLFTTHIFKDEQMIDLAYVYLALTCLPVALVCLLVARPAFARQCAAVQKIES